VSSCGGCGTTAAGVGDFPVGSDSLSIGTANLDGAALLGGSEGLGLKSLSLNLLLNRK
jgi:hypothetical protein